MGYSDKDDALLVTDHLARLLIPNHDKGADYARGYNWLMTSVGNPQVDSLLQDSIKTGQLLQQAMQLGNPEVAKRAVDATIQLFDAAYKGETAQRQARNFAPGVQGHHGVRQSAITTSQMGLPIQQQRRENEDLKRQGLMIDTEVVYPVYDSFGHSFAHPNSQGVPSRATVEGMGKYLDVQGSDPASTEARQKLFAEEQALSSNAFDEDALFRQAVIDEVQKQCGVTLTPEEVGSLAANTKLLTATGRVRNQSNAKAQYETINCDEALKQAITKRFGEEAADVDMTVPNEKLKKLAPTLLDGQQDTQIRGRVLQHALRNSPRPAQDIIRLSKLLGMS